MTLRSRALATVMLVVAALFVAAVPSARAATSLMAQPATSSVCHFSGGRLTSITAAGPRVKEQRWFRTHHRRQRSQYRASLQRLVGKKWSTLTATTKKRAPRLGSAPTRMPKLALAVPSSSTAKKYRVTTVVRWLGTGGRVVAAQRMVLAHYTGRTSACAAKKSGTTTTPSVTIAPSAGTVSTGTAVGGSFTVSGLQGATTATVNLYGPEDYEYGCNGSLPNHQVGQVAVSGDGTYSLPSASLPSSGVYYWQVLMGPAQTSTCSAEMIASKPVDVVVTTGTTDASLNRSLSAGAIQERLQYAGFDRNTTVDWTATLWGPYANQADADSAACTGQHTTINQGGTLMGPAGVSYNLTESASSMNGGQPAFWRVSVASTNVDQPQFESVPAKVCSVTFHTTK